MRKIILLLVFIFTALISSAQSHVSGQIEPRCRENTLINWPDREMPRISRVLSNNEIVVALDVADALQIAKELNNAASNTKDSRVAIVRLNVDSIAHLHAAITDLLKNVEANK